MAIKKEIRDSFKKSAERKMKKNKAEDKKQEVIEPEVMKDKQQDMPVVYAAKKSYEMPLQQIAACLTREISLSNKLNVASIAVDVRIGAGLFFAKKMIGGKHYTAWVEHTFKGDFSIRKAQYAVKAFKEFRKSVSGQQLQLPEPQEGGNFLTLADDNSGQFMTAIETWVNGRTQAELYDECRIRPIKRKGGDRPATRLIEEYQILHPHLMDKAYEIWPQDEKEAFKAWLAEQMETNDSVGETMAAQGAYSKIEEQLTDHIITKKTYVHLTDNERIRLADLLALAAKNVRPRKKK